MQGEGTVSAAVEQPAMEPFMLKIILQPMAEYRAYILDDSGDILLGEELVASSDAAAITAGLQIAALYGGLLPAQGIELWSARRLVFSTHPRR